VAASLSLFRPPPRGAELVQRLENKLQQ